MTRRLGILGSTGSIGTQALDVVRAFPDEFEVVALSTHTNTDRLDEQIEEFRPESVAISDPATREEDSGSDGDATLRSLARMDLDILLVSVAGMAGLLPTLDALEQGTDVALASKEAMVVGGGLIREEEERSDGRVLPVDSEHHAVFQLLRGEEVASVRRVYLTASGGPFLSRSREALKNISPEEALDHPNWDMGPKITIDSATMMNKGLELIEAKYFFDLDPDQIQAVIHPQSKVHALIEFEDRSVKAHLSEPDMRQSIQSVLFHPKRQPGIVDPLDLEEKFTLDFEPVNEERFPAYGLARRALREGGPLPTVLNASNAEAVRAFLNEEIDFLEIPRVVEQCLDDVEFESEMTVERTLEVDDWTRKQARTIMGDASGTMS